LPVSTGVSGLGTGVGTFLATPSSANLATAVTDETGSGSLVFATSPTLVTPILGTPTSGTLTNCTGYTTANLSGTISNAQLANSSTTINGTSIALGASGTVTAAAGTLTGTTLNSTVVTSSLTAVGTIATGVWNGTAIAIANGGTGQTTASAAFNALSPITTTGDLIIGNGTNSATRLAIGANTYVLTSNGTTASWQAASGGGGTQATATALGTVYAKQTTGGGSPYLTAFGYNAGVSTTGLINTAFGHQALFSNTTGTAHVAIGYNALYKTTADNNVGIGVNSLYNTTTGQNNVALGYASYYTNITSSDNTAIGTNAGYFQTGGANTAVGSSALYGASGSSTGTNNVAVGFQAFYKGTSASSGTAVGYQAGYNRTTAPNSTAFGYQALYNETTANGTGWNLALGLGALSGCTTGFYNIGVGGNAGNTLIDGSSNVFIGTFAAASATNVQNEHILGGLTGKGANTFYVGGSSGAYNQANSATWSVTSDQRLKKNIVDNTIGLEQINGIRIRNFEYRTKDEVTELPSHTVIEKSGVQLGVIAQELQQVLPDCVKLESTGVLAVEHDNIMWHLINAVKELSAKVTALEARVGA
jgi:hypothetical protein